MTPHVVCFLFLINLFFNIRTKKAYSDYAPLRHRQMPTRKHKREYAKLWHNPFDTILRV